MQRIYLLVISCLNSIVIGIGTPQRIFYIRQDLKQILTDGGLPRPTLGEKSLVYEAYCGPQCKLDLFSKR